MVKIVSGGQTGADMGGLLAAEDLKIPTGGMAPSRWRTERGANAALASRFHLRESTSGQYLVRTRANVLDSDGTVIFTGTGNLQGGSAATAVICVEHNKPVIFNPTVDQFKWWLTRNNIQVLNVAGNRESVWPGIEQTVRQFLVEALTDSGATTS